MKLGRVLLLSDGDQVKVGQTLEGLDVDARVIAHKRGPRTESIRYKSKKRVRVHRGGRAHLTALEIIAVGGVGLATEAEDETPTKAKPKQRGRAKAAPKKKAAKVKAEAVQEAVEEAAPEEAAAPKKPTRRRAKKESE